MFEVKVYNFGDCSMNKLKPWQNIRISKRTFLIFSLNSNPEKSWQIKSMYELINFHYALFHLLQVKVIFKNKVVLNSIVCNNYECILNHLF